MSDKNKEEERIIGRWTIGPTLGKGGYSWVKRGQDIKTGKIVALKFMEKADVSWVKEQAKQVETEIEALKNIRNQNVMKLYAYNLNAQYPLAHDPNDTHSHKSKTADKQYIDTILLVLEYAPGGELFDILYYTSALKENVARTYFKQIINGLEACHNNGVVHRDLKPQNLLLDAKYNLKITDFGLSKIIQSDSDAIMKTTYVGTRGYQAPELLLNKPYDLKCDIFSVGVILFILLAGYPPFEQAAKTDKWFKPMIKNDTTKFWKAHHKSTIATNDDAKNLLEGMLSFDPTKRFDISTIKSHAWYKGDTLKSKELISTIRERHRKAEHKRRNDVRKMNDLAKSLGPGRPIPGIEKANLLLFPENEEEGVYSDIYTYLNPQQQWYAIFNLIQEVIIGKKCNGQANFDFDLNKLFCEMKISKMKKIDKNKSIQTEHPVKFTVQIYRSRIWNDKYLKAEFPEEVKAKNEHELYVVRVVRKEGDTMIFRDVKNSILMIYCGNILKGLPKWADKMEEDQLNTLNQSNSNKDVDDQKEDDEYYKAAGDVNWD